MSVIFYCMGLVFFGLATFETGEGRISATLAGLTMTSHAIYWQGREK